MKQVLNFIRKQITKPYRDVLASKLFNVTIGGAKVWSDRKAYSVSSSELKGILQTERPEDVNYITLTKIFTMVEVEKIDVCVDSTQYLILEGRCSYDEVLIALMQMKFAPLQLKMSRVSNKDSLKIKCGHFILPTDCKGHKYYVRQQDENILYERFRDKEIVQLDATDLMLTGLLP